MGRSKTNTVIAKGGVATTGNYGANGLFSPEQATKFIDMVMESSEFLKKINHEKKKKLEGTISKLGVGSRLLRGKVEDTDTITGKEVEPVIGEVPYACKKMTLGTSITEDWLEENIEEENFEELFLKKIAEQIQVDVLDLAFNGDTATATSDKDYEFLKINDGWIKQIKAKGNIVDGATINGGKFSKAYFYALRRAVPKKYRNNKFRWICSDDTYTDLCEFLSNSPTALGDIAITQGKDIKILNTDFDTVPNIPDDVIIYADPKNLTMVFTKEIKHRKTTEGKSAIYEDKRFYATKLNADFVLLEDKATGILINKGNLA